MLTEGSEETNSAAPEPPAPRKRGRPKGLGKVPGSGRQKGSTRVALEDMAGAAETFLLDVVAGKQVYAGPRGSVGKAGWTYPTMDARMKAALALLDRVHPTLTAAKVDSTSQITGANGEPLHDPREVAKAVIGIIQTAVEADEDGEPTGARVIVDDGTEHIARFRDADLGRRILPGNAFSDNFGSPDEADQPGADGETDDGPKPLPPDAPIGTTVPITDAISVTLVARDATGREKFSIRKHGEQHSHTWGWAEAVDAARRFAATGKLTLRRPREAHH